MPWSGAALHLIERVLLMRYYIATRSKPQSGIAAEQPDIRKAFVKRIDAATKSCARKSLSGKFDNPPISIEQRRCFQECVRWIRLEDIACDAKVISLYLVFVGI
jgi:hypothetical protein